MAFLEIVPGILEWVKRRFIPTSLRDIGVGHMPPRLPEVRLLEAGAGA